MKAIIASEFETATDDEKFQDTIIIKLPKSLEEHRKRGDLTLTVSFTIAHTIEPTSLLTPVQSTNPNPDSSAQHIDIRTPTASTIAPTPFTSTRAKPKRDQQCPYTGVTPNSALHEFLEKSEVTPEWWDEYAADYLEWPRILITLVGIVLWSWGVTKMLSFVFYWGWEELARLQ